MCSHCEYDGLRGDAIKEENTDILRMAEPWTKANWFTMEIEWDSRTGVHWVGVKRVGEEKPEFMPVCQFGAFVYGLETAVQELKAAARRRGVILP